MKSVLAMIGPRVDDLSARSPTHSGLGDFFFEISVVYFYSSVISTCFGLDNDRALRSNGNLNDFTGSAGLGYGFVLTFNICCKVVY